MSAPERKLVVTNHAVDQLRMRRLDSRQNGDIRREIAEAVADALRQGHVLNHKPVRFRLYRERKKGTLPEGDRFVYLEDMSLGWIVRREPEQDVVMTTLTPTRAF